MMDNGNIIAQLVDSNADIHDVLVRFVINIVVLCIVVIGIYYRNSKKEDDVYALSLIGVIVFFICILLKNVVMQMGMALGLFAVFTLLSFRSKSISLKTMAYFFTVIGIAVINAMANFHHRIFGPFIINGIIIASVYILEKFLQPKLLSKVEFVSDNINVFVTGSQMEVVDYLKISTGRAVMKYDVKKIDMVKKTVEVMVYYRRIML
jgi:hypothetical protein